MRKEVVRYIGVVVVVCPFPPSSSLIQVLRKQSSCIVLTGLSHKFFKCQSGGMNGAVEQVRNNLWIHSTVWTT